MIVFFLYIGAMQLLAFTAGWSFSRAGWERRTWIGLAWRLRQQRNAERKTAATATSSSVLMAIEARRFQGAAYTLGSIIKEHESCIEQLRARCDKAEMELAKHKIPGGM